MIIEIDKGKRNFIFYSYPEYGSLETNDVKAKDVFDFAKKVEAIGELESPPLPQVETYIRENFFKSSSTYNIRRYFFRHDIDFYTANQDVTIQQIQVHPFIGSVPDIYLVDCDVRLFADSGKIFKAFGNSLSKRKVNPDVYDRVGVEAARMTESSPNMVVSF